MSRLLADEELRLRFTVDPFDTLAELHLRGLALTSDEIDVFVQSDVRVWWAADAERFVVAGRRQES
jgi:hypothetical protein